MILLCHPSEVRYLVMNYPTVPVVIYNTETGETVEPQFGSHGLPTIDTLDKTTVSGSPLPEL